MKSLSQLLLMTALTLTSIGSAFSPAAQTNVPVSGLIDTIAGHFDAPAPIAAANINSLPELSAFASSVTNMNADQVVGVYAPNTFALPVVQQPSNQAAYVSTQDNTVTQFAMTSKYNVVGLLAHNYLSGEDFFKLKDDQIVAIVFGDGAIEYYQVVAIQSFQALSPNSPFSEFVDLADPQAKAISSTELFKRIYTNENQVVFQTCIKAFGDASWGRLFVTAEKVEQPTLTQLTKVQ